MILLWHENRRGGLTHLPAEPRSVWSGACIELSEGTVRGVPYQPTLESEIESALHYVGKQHMKRKGSIRILAARSYCNDVSAQC